MKKISVLFVLVAAALAALAQDSIANGGFERWTHYSNYNNPDAWVTLNFNTAIADSFTCLQDSATAHSGKYSIELISKAIPIAGQVVPGILTNAVVDLDNQSISGGVIVHSRPTSVKGWFQYAIPGGPDTGAVRVQMISGNNTVGYGYFLFSQVTNTWTPFTVNINYSSAAVPDTFQIVFLTSVANNSPAQTTLLLDDLSFTFPSDACGAAKTLTQTSGLCNADTLQVWNATGATQIIWTYNGAVDSVNYFAPATHGTTVAGSASGHAGLADSLLEGTTFSFVDATGNLYVSDYYNNRVQKFAPGSNMGVTVAGDPAGSSGVAANLLDSPQGVFVDSSGNVYVADENNNRVQKWAPGAGTGVTVAGSPAGNAGTADSLLNLPKGIWIDAAQNLYIADENNNRVQQWAPGVMSGVTVAGSWAGNAGFADSLLDGPWSVCVDAANNIYITDRFNNRVQKWAPGASFGVRVAGDSLAIGGSGAGQFNNPEGAFVDPAGNVYVADAANNRIQKWSPGATAGITVAGDAGGATGTADSLFALPTWVWVDKAGSLYVNDFNNSRVQKWTGSINTNLVITAPGTYSSIVTNYYGCVDTTNVTVADTLPHPVIALSQYTLSTGSYNTYQWYLNGNAITNANSASYTAVESGLYQVQVTNFNGCSDTSASLMVIISGINELPLPALNIYPNPTEGMVNLQLSNLSGTTTLELCDALGRILYTQNTNAASVTQQLDLSGYASGIYLLRIKGTGMISVTRQVVKN